MPRRQRRHNLRRSQPTAQAPQAAGTARLEWAALQFACRIDLKSLRGHIGREGYQNGKMLYRAHIAFLQKNEAEAVCHQLKHDDIDCWLP
jgi:hypothetical protein